MTQWLNLDPYIHVHTCSIDHMICHTYTPYRNQTGNHDLGHPYSNGIPLTHLHGYREVCLSLWWEEDIHGFLGKGLVALSWVAHLNDVQLMGGVRLINIRYKTSYRTVHT